MAKAEELKNELEALHSSIPDLKGVLLASTEGLPIAHLLTEGGDPNHMAAYATAASQLGRKITNSLSGGDFGEVSVTGGDGSLFVYSVGSKAVLAVLTPKGANAGLIHLEARNAAHQISQLF